MNGQLRNQDKYKILATHSPYHFEYNIQIFLILNSEECSLW